MVFPAGIADEHLGCGRELAEEVGTDLSPPVPPSAWIVTARPSATISLSAPSKSACTALSYAGIPSMGRYPRGAAASVIWRSARLTQSRSGTLPLSSTVDADAEIHLSRVRIAVEGLGDPENRIARCEIHGTEQRGGEGSIHGEIGVR